MPEQKLCIDNNNFLPINVIKSRYQTIQIHNVAWRLSNNKITLRRDNMPININTDKTISENELLFLISINVNIPMTLLQLSIDITDDPLQNTALVLFSKTVMYIHRYNHILYEQTTGRKYGVEYRPNVVCELCYSNLKQCGEYCLKKGDVGTIEYGELHSDSISLTSAWSGDNYFCSVCALYKIYLIYHLESDVPFYNETLQKYPGAKKWLASIQEGREYADDSSHEDET